MSEASPVTEPPIRKRPLRWLAIRLIVVVLGVLLTWLGLEIILRVVFDSLPPSTRATIQNVQRYPWSDERLVPFLPLTADRNWGERGPVGLKDFPIVAQDTRYTVSTLSIWDGHIAGFRSNPARYPLNILVIGDSFSFCSTPFEDCWVQKLGQMGAWNVFNAGIIGTGPMGQFTLMNEIAPPTKPAVIVWQWFSNDVPDDYNLAHVRGDVGELGGPPSPAPVPMPSGLAHISVIAALIEHALTPPQSGNSYQLFQEMNVKGRMMLLPTNTYPSPYSLQYDSTRYGLQRNIESIGNGEDLARKIGATMVHVFIPTKEEVFADSLKDILGQKYLDQLSEARLRLLAECKTRGWLCIDPLPALQAAYQSGETVYYGYESHLDVGGNLVLAEVVYKYMTDKGLLTPAGK